MMRIRAALSTTRVRQEIGFNLDVRYGTTYNGNIANGFTLGCEKRKIFRAPEVNDGQITVCLLERWEVLAGIP